jgi:hypothetical protein
MKKHESPLAFVDHATELAQWFNSRRPKRSERYRLWQFFPERLLRLE